MVEFNEQQKFCNNCGESFIAIDTRHNCIACLEDIHKKINYCNGCGNNFLGSSRKHYCDSCFVVRYPAPKEWNRSEKKCKNCNNFFMPKQFNNSYCSDECRVKYHKEKILSMNL